MADYLVTSLGVSQSAYWACINCDAARMRRPQQEHEQFRETAAAHIRNTGHAVQVFRGTEELLAGVAYQVPEPLDGLRRHLTECHPGIGLRTGPTGMYPDGFPTWQLEHAHEDQHRRWPASQGHSHEPKAIRA
jgi:hypothetical protein